MCVLEARGGELERGLPYGVVRQLFERALASAPAKERERLLAGAAGLAAPAISLPTRGLPAGGEPGAVLHGLYWLAANLAAEQPLVIALDDAHWGDVPSLRFLSYLARRVGELSLLVLYATRTGEGAVEELPGASEPELLGALLCPAPLSEPAVAPLVEQVLGGQSSAELASACHRASGGNPFLLRELLRAVEAEGIAADDERSAQRIAKLAPQTISRALLARLKRLGSPAMRLVFAVAVLGASARLRHAAQLAGLEAQAAGETADALTEAGILGKGRPLEFAHPIVRAAVYAEIPAAKRAQSHKQAALILEHDGAGPDAIAVHLLATEPAADSAVVERLRRAARAVLGRGAPVAACAYLERALAEPPSQAERPALLLELGSAELRAGRPGAASHLRQALDSAPDLTARAAAAEELAMALAASERFEEGAEVLLAAIDELGQSDPETALRLEAMHVGAAQVGLTPQFVRARLARYEGRLRGETTAERLLLAVSAMQSALGGASAEQTAALAELALADGRLLTEQPPDSQPFYQAVMALAFTDRLERAERFLEGAVEEARARGSVFGFTIAAACRAHLLYRLGRIGEAEAEAHSALEASPHVLPALLPMVVAYALEPMIERTDLRACEALLEDSGLGDELPPGRIQDSLLLYARGHLRLAGGDARRALRDFEELRRGDERLGVENPAVWSGRASAALAHSLLGEREQALALAEDDLAAARRWGAPSAISFALRAKGIAAGGEAGIDLLREAAAVVERSPARCERARSLTELGAALRRAGHRRDARQPLREALELADRCSALRLAARARQELVIAGARPRRVSLSGLDSLTPSERRVAQLAAEGRSNREIAQALFVTLRTVEMHLTHAYQKLDIHSRDELAAVLGATGVRR